jgi:hypothetical protein
MRDAARAKFSVLKTWMVWTLSKHAKILEVDAIFLLLPGLRRVPRTPDQLLPDAAVREPPLLRLLPLDTGAAGVDFI